MYIELYLDVLFLVNFMMDFIILLIAKEILKCDVKLSNILVGAFLGGGLTCVVYVVPMHSVVRILLFHGVINVVMITVGLKIRSLGMLVKGILVLYIGSFLLGGVIQYFNQYVRLGSLYFAMVVFSYFLVKGIWRFICALRSYQEKWCEVEIYFKDSHIKVKAIIDTGNTLVDPYTNKPVSILDKEYKAKLELETLKDTVRYIPYHSIGGEGVLLAFKAKKVHIIGNKNLWIQQPIIALSNEKISKSNSYQMIVNPDIF